MQNSQSKPAFRGCFHQEAFFVSLGACALLIAKASDALSVTAASVYSFGLLFLFASSAIYHRFHWSPKQRQIIQRFDHSAIFIVIAATATPLAVVCLPAEQGRTLLWLIWGVGLCGVIQSIFWLDAPKWVMAAECVAMGWLSFPFLGALKGSLSGEQFGMLVAGGVAYSLGALFFATKWPKLWPAQFGYHELFHLLTVIGAAFHFTVIHSVIN